MKKKNKIKQNKKRQIKFINYQYYILYFKRYLIIKYEYQNRLK